MAALSDVINDYCFFDFETRLLPGISGDVTTLGTYKYARLARPIILTYAIGDGPVQCIDIGWAAGKTEEEMDAIMERWLMEPGEQRFRAMVPDELDKMLCRALRGEAWFCAWNCAFDRTVWNNSFYYSWLDRLTPEMTLDAMAQAAASNLPSSLQAASRALGGSGKQHDGKDLIRLFSPHDGATPDSHPAEWERFKSYAAKDVEVLREVFFQTRALPRQEWEDYWVSERINERGVAVDVPFCRAAYRVARANTEYANQQLAELTGRPMRVTTVQQIADWVYDRLDDNEARSMLEADIDVADDDEEEESSALSLTRARIGRLVTFLKAKAERTEAERTIIAVLELREYGGAASPLKFHKMAEQADGGRLKGSYVFNGAPQTGRFSSRGVQIHNLPRASLGDVEEQAIIDIMDLGEQ